MGYNSARNMFFEQVGKCMEKEDIYVVSADLAGPPFDAIRKEHPKRYVPVGIAEQNMISVSIGIALTGKKTIAYTSNPFIALRAFDQIRNGAMIMNAPLTIVGVGTGFSIAEYGTTHFVTEDMAIMSLCPGLRQVTISDDSLAKEAFHYMLNNDQPLYLRFDKECGGDLNVQPSWTIERGFRTISPGEDTHTMVITQGYTAHVIPQLLKESAAPKIIDMFGYPFNECEFIKELKDIKRIVVCEEQQVRGGLGSIILETLNRFKLDKEILRMGVDYKSSFPEQYGNRSYWLDYFNINKETILSMVQE